MGFHASDTDKPAWSDKDMLLARVKELTDALIQVRGFAAVMESNNWRDLQLHIKRQCNILDGQERK